MCSVAGIYRGVPVSQVAVAVEDVNDNAPRFMNDSYSATIPEGNYAARNEIIITVSPLQPATLC